MSQIITITLQEWKHKKLLQRIETLKQAMRIFKINENFKKAYLDDIYAIESIIKNHGGSNGKHNEHDHRSNTAGNSPSSTQGHTVNSGR